MICFLFRSHKIYTTNQYQYEDLARLFWFGGINVLHRLKRNLLNVKVQSQLLRSASVLPDSVF